MHKQIIGVYSNTMKTTRKQLHLNFKPITFSKRNRMCLARFNTEQLSLCGKNV